MAGETLIYVAGAPDCFPLEYYDGAAGAYRGVLPDLLEDFARETGYVVRYYEPGSQDRRQELAANRQVDLISCVVGDADYDHLREEPLLLFPVEVDGETLHCALACTDVAPEGFCTALASYVAGISKEAWAGEILEAVAEAPQPSQLMPLAAVAGALLPVLAAAVLAVALGRTRRRLREARRARLNDGRTGLWNEAGLAQAFDATVQDANRALYYLLDIHCDLDRLARLEGTAGPAGFLAHGAAVLKARTAPGDLAAAARDGDLLVLMQAQSQEAVTAWARETWKELATFSCGGALLGHGDLGVGVYSLRTAGYGLEEARLQARQGALAACREENGVHLCTGEDSRRCLEERQLLAGLGQALERQELQLWLQFLVDAGSHRVVGGETLSRWNHPSRGVLLPGRYVPLLEREGRIDRLDLFCLTQAGRFLAELEQRGVRDFFLSCNISRSTFAARDFPERCRTALEPYRFSRRLLLLELTESERMTAKEQRQIQKNIPELRAMGLRILLDDFGVGFSAFQDLQEFPMDGLKLDKCLVDNMETERGAVLLQSFIRTGHQLGLAILAEGVETSDQAETLARWGCDVLQGYHFSVPVPAPAAMRRILEGKSEAKEGEATWKEADKSGAGCC